MKRQFELVEAVKSYDPTADEDAINRAYVFAMKAHGSQMRASGDPYFSHPVEVAYILTDLRLDTASIVTALLHDTVEDTDATLDDIRDLFGDEVAQLVDGVTKLSQLESKSENAKQAENFRKLLIATSEDIRVLLVKLADRLHNMQTLRFVRSQQKRERIARETLEIYAALAERIGMHHLKEQLQDLAFAELFPDARESITERLKYLREEGKAQVEKIKSSLKKTIEEAGINGFEIMGREKRPYSIWRKMELKNISFEQLADIIAFRIIVDDIPACYQVLGAIHAKYHTVPGHFKDYISTPKNNGYQSIHTAIIGPYQQRIEVQIRTEAMHEIAEYGVAAHWSYKQNRTPAQKDSKQYRWIRELLEILEKSSGPEEFLEHTKLEMYHDQVFCFTPKGDIMPLPRGATAVDFAFAVHSAVGQTCVGAKVNGRIVPLRTQLRNGDQVEIITSKAQTPSPTWERFVVTGKARSEIRKFIRTQQRKEYINLGKAILVKTFRQYGKELKDKELNQALGTLNKREIDDIYAEVGEGTLSRTLVLQAVYPNLKPSAKAKSRRLSLLSRLRGKKDSGSRHAVPIKGLISGMAIHFAGCCHPIPGDAIVGIVSTGKGITIHTKSCETLENFADTPERWIDVAWDVDGSDGTIHVGRIKATLSHETGGLAALTNSIAKDGGNISNIKVLNRSSDFFELLVDIEVTDTEHLNHIIANLRAQSVVQSVERDSA